MNLNDLKELFIFNDGKIISIHFNFDKNEILVTLQIRKPLNIKVYEPIEVILLFSEIVEVSIFEDFSTSLYSDIAFLKTRQNIFYLSLDPYGNSGVPHEKDNLIIKARKLSWVNQAGIQQDIN